MNAITVHVLFLLHELRSVYEIQMVMILRKKLPDHRNHNYFCYQNCRGMLFDFECMLEIPNLYILPHSTFTNLPVQFIGFSDEAQFFCVFFLKKYKHTE